MTTSSRADRGATRPYSQSRRLTLRVAIFSIAYTVFAIAYTLLGKFGLSLDAVSGFAALVWPPAGLALAVLLLDGYRLWPGVLIGAFATNLWVGASPLAALGIACGNTLEALLGAYFVRAFGGFRTTFDRLRHILALVLGAAVISTFVSATIGIISLSLTGVIESKAQAVATFQAWWLGDAFGNLVVAPFILAWARSSKASQPSAARGLEAGVLILLLCAMGYQIFFRNVGALDPLSLPYSLLPLLVWLSLRFGMRGATTGTALTAVVALAGTIRGVGPLWMVMLTHALVALQGFIAVTALTQLIIAAAITERADAIRSRDSILATVSHDLRNPMNAVLISAEVLLRRLPEEPVRKHYELLKRSVDGMMRLITDLLDISALERGTLSIDRRSEDMTALAAEAVDAVRLLAPGKNIVLDVQGTARVLCDRTRVLQVFSNILGNAIRFSPEGGTVVVHVAARPRAAQVSISDSGPGIGPAAISHVFEPFYRVPSTRAGTGLGLSISKGIVEAHGGHIWVMSELGAGSTFCFTIPAAPTQEEEHEPASVWARWHARARKLRQA